MIFRIRNFWMPAVSAGVLALSGMALRPATNCIPNVLRHSERSEKSPEHSEGSATHSKSRSLATLERFLGLRPRNDRSVIYPIACADPSALARLSPSRLESALSCVARRHRISVVMPRKLSGNSIPDITERILRAAGEPPRTFPQPVSVALADPEKLLALHPFYPRYREIIREEKAWENGKFAAAQTPAFVPPGAAVGKKPFSKADEAALASIQSALQTAYNRDLQAAAQELSGTLRRRAGAAPSQAQNAVKAFAGTLRQFRDRKLAAYRKELVFEFQRKMKNRTGLIQESCLDFEKRLMAEDQPQKLNLELKMSAAPASKAAGLNAELKKINAREEALEKSEREALRKELEFQRKSELASLSQSLENQAGRLDRQILDKTAKYAQAMARASREALQEEQAGFKRAWKPRGEGPGGREKPQELRILALRGHALLEAGLQDDRRRVETLLRLKADAARKNTAQIASQAVAGLEREKNSLLLTMGEDIAGELETASKRRGVVIAAMNAGGNLLAPDLTPFIARQMIKQER